MALPRPPDCAPARAPLPLNTSRQQPAVHRHWRACDCGHNCLCACVCVCVCGCAFPNNALAAYDALAHPGWDASSLPCTQHVQKNKQKVVLAWTPPPSDAPNMCKRINRRWCWLGRLLPPMHPTCAKEQTEGGAVKLV